MAKAVNIARKCRTQGRLEKPLGTHPMYGAYVFLRNDTLNADQIEAPNHSTALIGDINVALNKFNKGFTYR
jgi:hypothetical protein